MTKLLLPTYAVKEFVLADEAGLDVPHASDGRDLAATLSAYDKGLELGYSYSAGKWIVRHTDHDGRQSLVMTLENDGGYRPPFADVFEDVMKSNMRDDRNRHRQTKAIEANEVREAERKRKEKDEDRGMMAERAHQIWVDDVNRRAPAHRTLPRVPNQ